MRWLLPLNYSGENCGDGKLDRLTLHPVFYLGILDYIFLGVLSDQLNFNNWFTQVKVKQKI
jgi:hypothetical protein